MTVEHQIFYVAVVIGSILITIELARYGFAQLGSRPLACLGLAINVSTMLVIGIIRKNFPSNSYVSWAVPTLCFLVFIAIRATKPSTLAYSKALFQINLWARTHYTHGKIQQEKAQELRNSRLAQNTIELLQHVINKERGDTPPSKLFRATAHLEMGFLYRIMALWDKAESHLCTCLQALEQLDGKYPDKNVWDYITMCDSKETNAKPHSDIPLSLGHLFYIIKGDDPSHSSLLGYYEISLTSG